MKQMDNSYQSGLIYVLDLKRTKRNWLIVLRLIYIKTGKI